MGWAGKPKTAYPKDYTMDFVSTQWISLVLRVTHSHFHQIQERPVWLTDVD